MALRKPLVVGDDGLPQQLQSGDSIAAPTTAPDLRTVTNAEVSAALVIGAPVYSSAAGAVKRAQANAKSTSHVAGLCYDASIAAGANGTICTDGVVIATTVQWDAVVTGGSGGLVFGTYYFLDTANAGKLTATPATTTGHCNVLVGRALSATELDLMLQPPILL